MTAVPRLARERLDGFPVAPGQTVGIFLQCPVTREGRSHLQAMARAPARHAVLVEAAGPPAGCLDPTSRRRPVERVLGRRALHVIPEAGNGSASLAVGVGPPAIAMTRIELQGTDRSYLVPPMQHHLGVAFGEFCRTT